MYKPLVGQQRRAVELTTARSNIYEGAVRSSKTVSTMVHWLKRVRTGPTAPMIMIGKSERTLKRNIIDPLTDMVGANRCKLKSGMGELELLGRTIYIAGAHDEGSAAKIQGLTLGSAYGDEITTWPASFYRMLMTRLSVLNAEFVGTTNPAGPNHWLMDYLKRARLHLDRDGQVHHSTDPEALNLHRFSFQLSHNPNLSAEYIADLSKEFTGLFYRRYILGEWVLAEGTVYESWDPDRHVVSTLPHIDTWLGVGLDYGSTNPFAALAAGIGTGPDGIRRVYLVSEYGYSSAKAGRQMAPAEYSKAVRAWLKDTQIPGQPGKGIPAPWIYVDPASDFGTQLYYENRDHPEQVLNIANADNDVLAGIQTVSSLIATDRFRVHDSCTGWIDEAAGYSWDPKATERGEDRPLKIGDHYMDAGRYILHSEAHKIRRALGLLT
jgi:PBSX family phage terminase large subunit